MNVVGEDVNDTRVCVEVCEGILKRDATFYVNITDSGSAECNYNDVYLLYTVQYHISRDILHIL